MNNYTSYQFDEFQLTAVTKTLTFNDEIVRLEPKVFDVLTCLVKNSPAVVTKNQMLSEVWQDTSVSDWALTRAIREVRKHLNSCKKNEWIKTCYGQGYQFIATVEEITPDKIDNQKDSLLKLKVSRSISNKQKLIFATALTIIMLISCRFKFFWLR